METPPEIINDTGGAFIINKQYELWGELQTLIDLIKHIANSGSKQHETANHNTAADKEDDKPRQQHGACRLSPAKPIDRLDGSYLQKQGIESQTRAQQASANSNKGNKAQWDKKNGNH